MPNWIFARSTVRALLFLAILCLPSRGLGHPAISPERGRNHNIHVSRGRMAIEGGSIAARIRFFQHDLEDAISVFYGLAGFSLGNTQQSDSLFLGYLEEHFEVVADSARLHASIAASGVNGEIWWFELHFDHGEPIGSLSVRNEMMFELFPDQKHFLNVTFFPAGNSRSLYFVAGSSEYEIEAKT